MWRMCPICTLGGYQALESRSRHLVFPIVIYNRLGFFFSPSNFHYILPVKSLSLSAANSCEIQHVELLIAKKRFFIEV